MKFQYPKSHSLWQLERIRYSQESNKGSTGRMGISQVTGIKPAQTVRKEQGKVVLADRQAATQREIFRPCCHV